jgi:hypothetical protein
MKKRKMKQPPLFLPGLFRHKVLPVPILLEHPLSDHLPVLLSLYLLPGFQFPPKEPSLPITFITIFW